MRRWLIDQLTRTEPARPLAMVRIALGACLLAHGVDLSLTLPRLLAPTILRLPVIEALPQLSLDAVPAFVVVWSAAAMAFTLGWPMRAAGALLLTLYAYLFLLDHQLYSNHSYFFFLVTLLLTVGDSAAALSVAARRRGERSAIAAWPVALLRYQLSIVYVYAALAKLNRGWLSGAAIARYLDLPAALLHPALLAALAWSTVALEGFLAFALWSRRLRPAAFVLGFGFHTAIVLTMQPWPALAIFSLATLACYLVFLDAGQESRHVAFDPSPPALRRLAALCSRLDWLRLHRFRPAAGAEWEVSGPDGTERGWRGVVAALEGLPLTCLWAPALRLIAPRARIQGGTRALRTRSFG